MSAEKYVQDILNLLKEAGVLALSFFDNSEPEFKADQSVITKADRAVSDLVTARLKPYVDEGHMLIGEEDPHHLDYFNQAKIDQAEYIWSVDPIDGTRIYANRIPLYGISIGLLKDQKPFLGGVYFPSLKELFYCDGTSAFFVQQAFTDEEHKTRIVPFNAPIGHQSVLLSDTHIQRQYAWDYTDCRLMISDCAVVDLCWPTIGRGCGATFHSSLWDFAGAWPVIRAAGMELRAIETGEVLSRLDISKFHTGTKTWQLKDFYIVSSQEHFPILRRKFTKKT